MREGAQDAHEAIRPTVVSRTPESVAHVLKRDELRLYTLIWERFVASQMAAGGPRPDDRRHRPPREYTFRATGSVMKFAGFTRVYEEGRTRTRKAATPTAGAEQRQDRQRRACVCRSCTTSDALDRRAIEPKQHFTEPPPRYTEATLVKALEENGIGRPSTYSTIVETIQARGYVDASKSGASSRPRSASRSTTCSPSISTTSST